MEDLWEKAQGAYIHVPIDEYHATPMPFFSDALADSGEYAEALRPLLSKLPLIQGSTRKHSNPSSTKINTVPSK
jgi:hypothetical protein